MPLSLIDHILKLTPYSGMTDGLHPWQSALISLAIVFVATVAAETIYRRATRPPFRPTGKLCLITGGSTGLGKALAVSMAASGADVVIVARREAELATAVKEIEVGFTFSFLLRTRAISKRFYSPRRRMSRR
jgi:NADPH:quinone reductase-like Zn-dependent oxidoreductase